LIRHCGVDRDIGDGDQGRRLHYFDPTYKLDRERLLPVDLELLIRRGCFSLPDRCALDALVAAYFSHSHPVYPVVDRADFASRYKQVYQGGVSYLLLWSILSVGAMFCPFEHIRHLGFHSRIECEELFADRAKVSRLGLFRVLRRSG
jgi:hypothetical protein